MNSLIALELSSADGARHPAQIAYGPDDPERDVRFVTEFFDAMTEWKGVGLAAPQVGISSAVAVVEYNGERFVLSNPELTDLHMGVAREVEGCLSLPGRQFAVERARAVTVNCYDQLRGQRAYMAQGWLARIFQHECDHLRGVLIDSIGTEVIPDSDQRTDGQEGTNGTV